MPSWPWQKSFKSHAKDEKYWRVKTRSSKRIDEYSSRINMYYLNYYYYYHLPPPFVIIVVYPHTSFLFFFLEAKRSEKRFLTANCWALSSFYASRRPLLLHKKFFHALTGTCALLTRRDLIHRLSSTHLHRREYICRKYTSSISIRTHFWSLLFKRALHLSVRIDYTTFKATL